MTSDRSKDFLALSHLDLGRQRVRVARLVGRPLMPRPQEAMLREGFLTWSWYAADFRSPALQTAPPQLCFAFARLAQASDEAVRCFAKKWGPLNRYKRELESVKMWRHYARLAQALLRFTAYVRSGDQGDQKDWRVICNASRRKGLELQGLKEEEKLATVAASVNTWFAQAREHGILTILGKDLQVRPHASDLFGVLVTQIAHIIARSDQMAVCAGCHDPFKPKRLITRGIRQYCQRCRNKKVPQRDASRDWRRRAAREEGGMRQR